MEERISLGASPYAEQPAQLGSPDYLEVTQKELRAFRGQLLRHYKAERGTDFPAVLRVVRSAHDFGSYHELYVYFDTQTEEAAYWLESNIPEHWDDEALLELGRKRED